MKLTIELVPRTCWFSNLRKELKQSEWDKVRKYTYGLSKDYSCMICGRKVERLEAHEIWAYDEANHIQKLIGLVALCHDCHSVKHIGHTKLQGKEKFDQAVKHFCRVNDCEFDKFEYFYEEAFRCWDRRSKIKVWNLDISYLKDVGFEDIYRKYAEK